MGFCLFDESGPGPVWVGEFDSLRKGQGNLSWSCSCLLSELKATSRFNH